MKVSKITFLLLLASYYSDGHYTVRKHNNQQRSPGYSSLNFRTFPQYFKPLFRVNIPQRSFKIGKRIPKTSTTKYGQTRSNQGDSGMLSFVNNVLKPSIMKVGMPSLVKHSAQKRPRDRRLNGLRLRLIPQLIRKAVAKKLRTILGTRPINKPSNNSVRKQTKIQGVNKKSEGQKSKSEMIKNKSEIIKNKSEIIKNKSEMIKNKSDVIKNKFEEMKNKTKVVKNKSEIIQFKSEEAKNISDGTNKKFREQSKNKSKQVKNETNIVPNKEANKMDKVSSNGTGVIKNTGEMENFINKIEAKSILGNFIGNKHFANIFVFYPKNVDTPIVLDVKDTIRDVFNESMINTSTHEPIDKVIKETAISKDSGLDQSEDADNPVLSREPVGILRIPDLLATTTDSPLDNENQSSVDKLKDLFEEGYEVNVDFIGDDGHKNGSNTLDEDNDSPDKESDNITSEKDLPPTVLTTIDSITEQGLVTSSDISTPSDFFSTESDAAFGESSQSPLANVTDESMVDVESNATKTEAKNDVTSDPASVISTTTELLFSDSDTTTLLDNLVKNSLENHKQNLNQMQEEIDDKDKTDDLDNGEHAKNDDEEDSVSTTATITTEHDAMTTKDSGTVKTTTDVTTSTASAISTTTELFVTNDSTTVVNELNESTPVDVSEEIMHLKDDNLEEDESDDQENDDNDDKKTIESDDKSGEMTHESDKSTSTELLNSDSTTLVNEVNENSHENTSEESKTTKVEDDNADKMKDDESDEDIAQPVEKDIDSLDVSTTNAAITTMTTETDVAETVESPSVTESENMESTTEPITDNSSETATTSIDSTTQTETDDIDEYPTNLNSDVDDTTDNEYFDIEYAYF